MRAVFLFLIFFNGHTAISHPVSINWINGEIDRDRLIITYKIFAEDLVYFHQPPHDDYYNYDPEILRSLTKNHGEIIKRYFQIQDRKGTNLIPEIIAINVRSMSDSLISVMDLMKIDILYRIEFKLDSENWEALTFIQTLGNHEVGIPSVSFLSIYEGDITLIENQELSTGQPFTLKKGERHQTIEPSELTSSYFSISNTGVRHELTIPVETFNSLLSQSRNSGLSFADRVTGYFRSQNPVFDNDNKLTPQLSNITSLTTKGSGNGFMYIDIIYPTSHYPDNIELTWNDYNWRFRWFDSEIFSVDSLYQHTFSRFQPKIKIKPEIKFINPK